MRRKRHNDDLELITRLVNSSYFEPRIKCGELENFLGKEGVEQLISLGVIDRRILEPTNCERCGSSEIETWRVDDLFNVKCKNCGKKYVVRVEDRAYFDVSYRAIAEKYLRALGAHDISIEKEEHYVKGFFSIDSFVMSFVFIPHKMRETDLLPILYSATPEPTRVLFLINDENFERILNLSAPIALGGTALIIPVSQFDAKEIRKWINVYSEILKMEDSIIRKIGDKELKELIVSVNTNPKYALTLLTHLKVLKALKAKDFNWKMLENITATVFRYMYASDVSFGGHKNLGERLPDNVFYVIKNGEPVILGLVDCKSSQVAVISRELTEKYVHYLERARRVGFLKQLKKVLIFAVFDFKNNSIIKFYERLEDYLRDNEYIPILPVNVLMLIFEVYLNWAIRSELQLKEEDKNIEAFIKDIFDIDYLKKLKRKYKESNSDIITYDKLFRLNVEDLLTELNKMISSSSSYQDVLRHYARYD